MVTVRTNKRKYAVIAACFFFYIVGYSQQFSRTYYGNRPGIRFTSIAEQNEFAYLTGLTAAIDSPNYLKAVWCKIDMSGNADYVKALIDTLPYSYTAHSNNLKISADGNFLLSGEMIDTTGKIFLCKTDTNGNLLFYVSYADTTLLIFQAKDFIEMPNKGYLIAVNACYKSNENSVVMLIRTDAAGNILNKVVHDLVYTELPWLIRPMLNGNFMIGAVTYNYNSNWARTWLIEVDSMGNYINQWIDTSFKNYYPLGMQQTADSGWIITRLHIAYSDANNQLYNSSLIKLDKNFHREWEVIRGDSGFDTGLYDIEILPDGKYIACGTTPTWGHDSAYQWGWLVKIDTDGTVLWDRKYAAYERFGTQSFLYDIDALPNGDLLACGELRFSFNVGITPVQQGWILRTDSNGCVIDNCITGIDDHLQAQDLRQMQIQPNPASSSVQITLENELLGGELKLYNVTGKLIIQRTVETTQTLLNVSSLAKGMYLIIAEKQLKQARGKLVIE